MHNADGSLSGSVGCEAPSPRVGRDVSAAGQAQRQLPDGPEKACSVGDFSVLILCDPEDW